MAVSSHGKHGNHTETRKIKKLIEVMMYIAPPAPTPNPRKSTECTKWGQGRSYERLSAVIEKFLGLLDVLRFGVMDG